LRMFLKYYDLKLYKKNCVVKSQAMSAFLKKNISLKAKLRF
jgi:hypothetical protein